MSYGWINLEKVWYDFKNILSYCVSNWYLFIHKYHLLWIRTTWRVNSNHGGSNNYDFGSLHINNYLTLEEPIFNLCRRIFKSKHLRSVTSQAHKIMDSKYNNMNLNTVIDICAICELICAVMCEWAFSTADHIQVVKGERLDWKNWDIANDAKLQEIASDQGAFKKRLLLRAKHTGDWMSVRGTTVTGIVLVTVEFCDFFMCSL